MTVYFAPPGEPIDGDNWQEIGVLDSETWHESSADVWALPDPDRELQEVFRQAYNDTAIARPLHRKDIQPNGKTDPYRRNVNYRQVHGIRHARVPGRNSRRR